MRATMPQRSLLLLSLMCLASTACATGIKVGSFSDRAFMAERMPYYVEFGKDGSLLGPDWVVENLQPGANPRVSKLGEEHETVHAFDADGDGQIDKSVKLARHDLLLRHRRSRATIWLSVFPISQVLADADADVLLRQYIEAVSGAGSFTVTLADGTKLSQERRYATRQVDMTPLTVQGQRAAGATFELAVDQLQLNQDSRWSRGRVLLVRTEASWNELGASWPVVMLAGYENVPDRFDDHAQDFTDFVSRIRFIDDFVALVPYRAAIGRCLSSDGVVAGTATIHVDGAGVISALTGPTDEMGYAENLMPCVTKAHPGGIRLAPTGFARSLRFSAEDLARAAARVEQRQQLTPKPPVTSAPAEQVPITPEATPAAPTSGGEVPVPESAEAPAAQP